MSKTKLILVGGFLAAGKTTMLNALAGRLTKRGFTVGLITNDQAADLVDTAILTCTGVEVREVSGSCFCCNFPGFMKAVESLIAAGCNLIVAALLFTKVYEPLMNKKPGDCCCGKQ